MTRHRYGAYAYVLFAALILFILGSDIVFADHAWSKYHWNLSTAETLENPLILGDNLAPTWQGHLAEASLDWNDSVLKNTVALGASNANCDPTLGQVEVCSGAYGENGWLGIAQVWIYRGKDGHIAQSIVKLNDTYFAWPQYNTSIWKDFVMCQEIGHTFGLNHQDEAFGNANLGTCMDYTNDPARDDGAGANLQPNAHDYAMLESIYAHLNGSSGSPGGGKGGGKGKPALPAQAQGALNTPAEWGLAVAQDTQGRDSEFVRNLGNGIEVVTHVLWTLEDEY